VRAAAKTGPTLDFLENRTYKSKWGIGNAMTGQADNVERPMNLLVLTRAR
jgi:hypothetical protein